MARWWRGRGQPLHTVVAHAGAAKFRGLRFSMDACEIASLAEALAPDQLIPVHYEEWSHFQGGKEALRQALRSRRVVNVRWLPWRSPEPLSIRSQNASFPSKDSPGTRG